MANKATLNMMMGQGMEKPPMAKGMAEHINSMKAAGKLGSGKRFAALKSKLSHEKGIRDPGALAASIGRKKYGAKKFQSLAAHGKKG